MLNLSLWRGDYCVGSIRLLPEEVSRLVSGLTAGLAQIAGQSAGEAGVDEVVISMRLREVEKRLAALDSQVRTGGRRVAEPLAHNVAGLLMTWLRRWLGRHS
jgi:hypothetical protein